MKPKARSNADDAPPFQTMKTKTKPKSQNQRLLSYLKRHRKGITTMEAFQHLGICRLSERIREIEGMAKACAGYPFYEQAHLINRTKERHGLSNVTRYKLAR